MAERRNRLILLERQIAPRTSTSERGPVVGAYDKGARINLRFSPDYYRVAPNVQVLPSVKPARSPGVVIAPARMPSARPPSPAAAPAQVASTRPPVAPQPAATPRTMSVEPPSSADEETLSSEDRRFLDRMRTEAPPSALAQAQTLSTAADGEPTEAPIRAPERPAALAADDPHAFFDRLTFANAFDAGSLSVEPDFDAFDRALDAEQRVARERVAAKSADALSQLGDVALVEDLAIINAPPPVATAQNFSIRYDVQLVPQQTGMSCWAAGAAMLVGWRDKVSINPSEIARAIGYWQQYQSGLQAEDTTMFAAWGLVPEPPQSYTVPAFCGLLQTYGPLWVASAEPGPHIRVVTGIWGDGSWDGTMLEIADPWEQGMAAFRPSNNGSRYMETYAQFVAKQETLARQESKLQGIYVAHLSEPVPPGAS